MVQLTTASRIFCVTLLMQFESRHVLAQGKWYEEKFTHRSKPISVNLLERLALMSPRTGSFESILDPILIPRVPGTTNHTLVKKYLIDHMKNLGWHMETDPFESKTPHGPKSFENIIATLNPEVPRRLVLACHFDSKYSKDFEFIGATDSAVPCAMLLHLAHTMQSALKTHKETPNQKVTLQFIFFDGEEAFVEWEGEDNTYGSRHLAKRWEDTPFILKGQSEEGNINFLHRIDVLVLLDLLGATNPKFFNYFDSTSHWHTLLMNTETALKKNGHWSGPPRQSKYFQDFKPYGGIEDDHIPFKERGVDIVHVIPSPFPSVWHKKSDNKAALHFPTIDNLNKIFRSFVAGYLHLDAA